MRTFRADLRIHNAGRAPFTVDRAGWVAGDGHELEARLPASGRTLTRGGPDESVLQPTAIGLHGQQVPKYRDYEATIAVDGPPQADTPVRGSQDRGEGFAAFGRIVVTSNGLVRRRRPVTETPIRALGECAKTSSND